MPDNMKPVMRAKNNRLKQRQAATIKITSVDFGGYSYFLGRSNNTSPSTILTRPFYGCRKVKAKCFQARDTCHATTLEKIPHNLPKVGHQERLTFLLAVGGRFGVMTHIDILRCYFRFPFVPTTPPKHFFLLYYVSYIPAGPTAPRDKNQLVIVFQNSCFCHDLYPHVPRTVSVALVQPPPIQFPTLNVAVVKLI